ncbi:MAG: hypothetical protein N3A58_04350 [Spirochaetes bacterium]|nr:hypothetical protein [Spirochaetota bacterium]
MKRFLGILIALLLVFSGVAFAQQQSTKTLDDIDAKITALGTFSWAAYGYYSWQAYFLNTLVGVTVEATPKPIYKDLIYLNRAVNLAGYATLTIRWAGVTLANTIYYDDPANLGLGLYSYLGYVGFFNIVQRLTFTKDNISLWGEVVTDFSNATMSIANKYKIYDMGLTISKIFDIWSLRIGGFGRVTIREFSPLYPNRLFANGSGDFRDRGIPAGISGFNTGAPTWVRIASTFNLIGTDLQLYIWNRMYTATTNIADYLGNAQNTTIGIKYAIKGLGIFRFNIQQAIPFKMESVNKAAGSVYTGSPAGMWVLKYTPTNIYFAEFRLQAVKNLDLLITGQINVQTRLNRDPAKLTGTGTFANPYIMPYKDTIKIDAGIDALYTLGDSMDVGLHIGFNTISGMNILELTGTAFTTPTVGGLVAYVASNYTEANKIQKTYSGDLFNAGLYFNYYLDKFTFSLNGTFSYLGWNLESLTTAGTIEFYGYGSTASVGLNISYAISKVSKMALGLSYYLYLGVPAYNSNWETQYGMTSADWKYYVDDILGPYFTISVSYEVVF